MEGDANMDQITVRLLQTQRFHTIVSVPVELRSVKLADYVYSQWLPA